MKLAYQLCWWICRVALFFWHPVYHVTGQEHWPAGRCVLCANHSGLADPIWILLSLPQRHMIRIMAKQELRRVPFIGWLMARFGVIFVARGAHDTAAFDACVQALRSDEKLLVFIEGTRCKKNKRVRARTGAVRMAASTGAPIVPLYVTHGRRPFCPIHVVFGAPIEPQNIDTADHDACQALADEVLRRIYALGGNSYAAETGENSGLLLRR